MRTGLLVLTMAAMIVTMPYALEDEKDDNGKQKLLCMIKQDNPTCVVREALGKLGVLW